MLPKILSGVMLAVIAALSVLIVVGGKKRKAALECDFCTYAGKGLLGVAWVFIAIGAVALAVALPVPDKVIAWLLFGLGTFIGLCGLLILFSFVMTYEYIVGDTVVTERFFFRKSFSVSDVKTLKTVPLGIYLFDGKNKKLCSIDAMTGGARELIDRISSRKDQLEEQYKQENPDEYEREQEFYNELGQQIRDNYVQNKKKHMLIYVAQFVLMAIVFAAIGIITKEIPYFVGAVFMLILCAIGRKKQLKNFEEPYKLPNGELGKLHSYEHPEVIGHGAGIIRKIRTALIVVGCFMVFFGLVFTMIATEEPDKKEELVEVTGNLEALYHIEQIFDLDDEGYVSIALEGDEVEYRLYDGAKKLLYSVANNISTGAPVVLLVEDSEPTEDLSESSDREVYLNVRAVTVDGVEHFTYGDYVATVDEANADMMLGAIIVGAAGLLCFVAIGVVCPIIRAKSKQREHITLYERKTV